MQKDKVEEEKKDQKTANSEKETSGETTEATVQEQEESETSSDPEESQDSKADEQNGEDQLRAEVAEAKDKYLRLYSEFENFRRRTSRERIELIGSATKELVENLIPVLDDFERAIKAMEEDKKTAPAKEGTELIYNKFKKVLEAKGLKKMEVKKGDDFNEDYHEAITQIPTEEKLAGKVVDVVENGYFLNDKVVRFAKVVTGAKS